MPEFTWTAEEQIEASLEDEAAEAAAVAEAKAKLALIEGPIPSTDYYKCRDFIGTASDDDNPLIALQLAGIPLYHSVPEYGGTVDVDNSPPATPPLVRIARAEEQRRLAKIELESVIRAEKQAADLVHINFMMAQIAEENRIAVEAAAKAEAERLLREGPIPSEQFLKPPAFTFSFDEEEQANTEWAAAAASEIAAFQGPIPSSQYSMPPKFEWSVFEAAEADQADAAAKGTTIPPSSEYHETPIFVFDAEEEKIAEEEWGRARNERSDSLVARALQREEQWAKKRAARDEDDALTRETKDAAGL